MSHNKLQIDLLRGAAKALRANPYPYTSCGICYYVSKEADKLITADSDEQHDNDVRDAVHMVHDRIENLLGGDGIYLYHWLWDRHGIEALANPEQLRETRLAWIDDMIKYWENKR
jgi:hypothetical protein